MQPRQSIVTPHILCSILIAAVRLWVSQHVQLQKSRGKKYPICFQQFEGWKFPLSLMSCLPQLCGPASTEWHRSKDLPEDSSVGHLFYFFSWELQRLSGQNHHRIMFDPYCLSQSESWDALQVFQCLGFPPFFHGIARGFPALTQLTQASLVPKWPGQLGRTNTVLFPHETRSCSSRLS